MTILSYWFIYYGVNQLTVSLFKMTNNFNYKKKERYGQTYQEKQYNFAIFSRWTAWFPIFILTNIFDQTANTIFKHNPKK